MVFYNICSVFKPEATYLIQDLALKSDTWPEVMGKIGTQVWRQLAPSLAGSYSYNKLMAAINGERDWALRERSVPEAMFDTLLGLKIRSIDYTEELEKRLRDISKETNVPKGISSIPGYVKMK